MSINSNENVTYYLNLRNELINKFRLIKDEFELNPDRYQDVLNVSFDSKVRLTLSIMKVLFFFVNLIV